MTTSLHVYSLTLSFKVQGYTSNDSYNAPPPKKKKSTHLTEDRARVVEHIHYGIIGELPEQRYAGQSDQSQGLVQPASGTVERMVPADGQELHPAQPAGGQGRAEVRAGHLRRHSTHVVH